PGGVSRRSLHAALPIMARVAAAMACWACCCGRVMGRDLLAEAGSVAPATNMRSSFALPVGRAVAEMAGVFHGLSVYPHAHRYAQPAGKSLMLRCRSRKLRNEFCSFI